MPLMGHFVERELSIFTGAERDTFAGTVRRKSVGRRIFGRPSPQLLLEIKLPSNVFV